MVFAHSAVEVQQLYAGVLGYVFGAEGRGGTEGGEPGWEGDGFDGCWFAGGGGGEVVGYGRDEGVPGADVGVDDVVMVEL